MLPNHMPPHLGGDWGFLSMAEKYHLQSVIRKPQIYGFLPSNFQNACDIVESLESSLFYLDLFLQTPTVFCFAFSP